MQRGHDVVRLVTRDDLGGYAASKAKLDVEVTKPFVLLCGPNGSGKTATLRMMRSAMGLTGERAGATGVEDFGPRPIGVDEAHGDLGKLAAMRSRFGGDPEMPRDSAGVLDVSAMGWRGQRTWLFDSRFETLRLSPSHFEAGNLLDHASAMLGARQASHGEAIRHAWMQAMRFASGTGQAWDPYDLPDRLPPNLRALRDAAIGTGARPEERWLLLDEPEVAVDLNAFSTGLALMLEVAGPGRLRVFCASHSPLFPAGLADHPKVQVVDVGPVPWLERQRTIFDMMRDPARMSPVGARVLADLRADELLRKATAEAEETRGRREEAKGLSKKGKAILLAVAEAPGGLLREFEGEILGHMDERAVNGLSRRPKLVREVRDKGGLALTDEGRALADFIEASAARAKGPRKRAPARPGAAGPAEGAAPGPGRP